MRFRTLLAAASVLGALAAAGAPARAFYRDDIQGPRLAYQLRESTWRLHESADRGARGRGFYGAAVADRLHNMDTWAGYYVKAVERHGFRSRMARQRFDRFLVEYRAACQFLDRRRFRGDTAVLHATVDHLSRTYRFDVDWERDRGYGGGWEDARGRRSRW
jgi:hypothetical protein